MFTDLHEISEMFSRLEGCSDHYRSNGMYIFRDNHSERQAVWRAKNPTKRKAQVQRYYAKNREAILERRRESRATKRQPDKRFARIWTQDMDSTVLANTIKRAAELLNICMKSIERRKSFLRFGRVCVS